MSAASPIRGFALVLTLGLTSFLLLLALGLIAQTRVALENSGNGLERLRAKEAARLALFMAFGELQSAAGADQRVTARADVLGEGVPEGHRHWTGVWMTGDDAPAPPRWLVSGVGAPNPQATEGEGQWILGGPPDGTERRTGVRVPVVDIGGADGSGGERFCWWVADEGVKASLAKHRPFDRSLGGEAFSVRVTEILRATTPFRFGVELFFPGLFEGSDPDFSEWEHTGEALRKGLWKDALPLVRPVSEGELEAAYHALTWNSHGVLSDSGSGGLKKDLGHPETSGGTVFADADAIRTILNRWQGSADSAVLRGHGNPFPAAGTACTATPVLVHELGLYMGVFRENSGPATRLKLHLTLRAEIWNPHGVPLEMTDEGLPDLRVRIMNLPTFTARWRTAAGGEGEASGAFSFDLASLGFEADRGHASFAQLEEDGIPVDLYEALPGADTRLKPSRFHASIGKTVPDASPSGDDFIALDAGVCKVDIQIETADGEVLQSFEQIPFESFSSDLVREQELLPVYGSGSPSYADHQAVFHFRLRDGHIRAEAGLSSEIERWFSVHDFRAGRIDFSDTDDGAPSGMFEVDAHPGENIAFQTNFFMGDPELFNGGNFIRAFDLPLSPVVSIGWLQQVHFHGGRPFAIGNPWGGGLNDAFDAFFLSGYPQGDGVEFLEEPLTMFPNPHLVAVGGADDLREVVASQNAAENLLVSGSFNINSSSVDAWRALLASHRLGDWSFRVGYDADPVKRPELTSGAFRFPQSAHLHYKSPYMEYPDYPEITQAEKANWYKWQSGEPDWLNAYDVGMRELRGEDVDELAAAIVELLGRRGRPFGSLAEFVNSGILQEAIDRTAINSMASGDETSYADQSQTGDAMVIPRYAPSFLTQADLLSTFAPVLSARSDTFLIRACGQSRDPVGGGVVAEVLCEALVQRFPEAVDPGDEAGGRRFKIVFMRWLTPGES